MASAALAGAAVKAQLGFATSTFSGQGLKAASSTSTPVVRARAGVRAAGYDEELKKTAQSIATKGRGILAMDESNATAGLRLASIGVENTEENRRQYRELLVSAPGLGQYVSGAILFEETLYQSDSNGKKFVDVLNEQNIIPGIKVDKVSRQRSLILYISIVTIFFLVDLGMVTLLVRTQSILVHPIEYSKRPNDGKAFSFVEYLEGSCSATQEEHVMMVLQFDY